MKIMMVLDIVPFVELNDKEIIMSIDKFLEGLEDVLKNEKIDKKSLNTKKFFATGIHNFCMDKLVDSKISYEKSIILLGLANLMQEYIYFLENSEGEESE